MNSSPKQTMIISGSLLLYDAAGNTQLENPSSATGRAVLFVWDAMAGILEVITMRSDWTACDQDNLNGAVVCTASDDAEGRHGDCRASPFLVVLISGRAPRAFVIVYSSVVREWSQMIWYDGLPMWADVCPRPCVVIGTTLYQPLHGSHTLSFHLETRNFAVIHHPPETRWTDVRIMKLDGTMLGLVVADNAAFSLHFWAWEQAGDHWVRRQTPEPALAAAAPRTGSLRSVELLGACEFGNVIFLKTRLDTYLFYLDLMQLKKLCFGHALPLDTLSPYESFYAPSSEWLTGVAPYLRWHRVAQHRKLQIKWMMLQLKKNHFGHVVKNSHLSIHSAFKDNQKQGFSLAFHASWALVRMRSVRAGAAAAEGHQPAAVPCCCNYSVKASRQAGTQQQQHSKPVLHTNKQSRQYTVALAKHRQASEQLRQESAQGR
ncbi:hypothetical protein EJB05_22892, partial [Eragrostis curvula]